MPDRYRTPRSPGEAQIRVKGSRFLGILQPCPAGTQWKKSLESLHKQFFNATHVCWAVREGGVEQFNDDGEPSGTAGRPILGALLRENMDDALLAVVRYFGGTKLGTGGLARAYGEAATQAIQATVILERRRCDSLIIQGKHASYNILLANLDAFDAVLKKPIFAERFEAEISVPLSQKEALTQWLEKERFTFKWK